MKYYFFLLSSLFLFLSPWIGLAESALPPDSMLLARISDKPQAAYAKSDADLFMDTISDVMQLELVRSVLSESDEETLARMLWGEDRENPTYQRAAIIWCVFNRMDSSQKSIEQLVTSTQFPGYRDSNPVKDWALEIVRDVAIRYVLEQNGFQDVGRVLPRQYLYYEQLEGKRFHVFKTRPHLSDKDNIVWDWSLPSPYTD